MNINDVYNNNFSMKITNTIGKDVDLCGQYNIFEHLFVKAGFRM